MTIAYEPADHPRAQGTVERLGGWLHEALGELSRLGLADGTSVYSRHCGSIVPRQTCAFRAFRLLFGRDARTQLDATHLKMGGGDFRGGMHSYVADKRQAYKEVRWLY